MLYRILIVSMTVITIVNCSIFGRLFRRSDIEESSPAPLPPPPGIDFTGALKNFATFLSVQCDLVSSLQRSSLEKSFDENDIRVYLYVSGGFISYKITDAAKYLLETPQFRPLQHTILFVHGFRNTPDEINVERVAAYYYRRGFNFLSFASNVYTSGSYLAAYGLTPHLGRILANFIMSLVDSMGVPYDRIHLVGYSLGAQFSGVAGRIFQRERGIMLPRITAIDPATVCFAVPSMPKLSKNDAAYVDAIHTTILSFSEDTVGHADFYVNGDSPVQPGCPSIPCSHTRSLLIYAESIANETAFVARQCDNWQMFQNGECDNRKLSIMGFGSPMFSRGKYFLKTNDKNPFGMGMEGLL